MFIERVAGAGGSSGGLEGMTSRPGPACAAGVALPEENEPGMRGERTTVSFRLMELYIALKSKPVAILVGPAGCGKLAAARALGSRLARADATCFQQMVGHAWWASRSAGVALFTEAQQRFNREKMLAMIEEDAAAPAGGGLRVALLSRISPAEWSEIAGLTTLVAPETSCPIPGVGPRRSAVSRSILLMATADVAAPAPWDPELLRTVSILSWGRHK